MMLKSAGNPRKAGTAAAGETAVAALGFIAADETRLIRFLGETGFDPSAIRDVATRPDFLAGVLGWLCADERMLVDFAAAEGRDPTAIMRDLAALGGVWERDTP
jgi:hypothetical protein